MTDRDATATGSKTTVEDARLARAALTWLVEPGNRDLYALVSADGPSRALSRLASGDVPAGALRGAAEARLRTADPWQVATAALAKAERLGARLVIPEDDEWPARLDDLCQIGSSGAENPADRDSLPPLCLWVRGPWPLAEALERSVAVVGARAATSYGLHVATDLGYGLAERGWTVVSGGAYGIDAAAHRGALTAGGITVAVLACGVDRPYPASNTGLFDRIAERGLLISEWPPGAAPFRHRFLIRNRVIAAATKGTVVVEASARSGAKQTVGRALRLRRPAMAVPGPVTSAMSVGCHELLREYPDVRLVTGVPQVLEEVGRIGDDLAPVARGPHRPRDDLDATASALLDAMPRRRTAALEEIAAAAGVDLREVMRKLPMLAHLGFVVERDGGYALTAKGLQ
ncbi:MAG: DNA-protecting protein DprA [Micromonosporaceae bacterium]|jgi:DNA processing protein|nr:DNA-protecting protein DprA [Micromonosporaceae bacterium]